MNLANRAKNMPLRRNEMRPQEWDRLFDDFFRSPLSAWSSWPEQILQGSQESFNPSIDVSETEKEYQVKAELPGVNSEDVELSLDNNVLSIKGEKKSETKEERGGQFYMERTFGSFQRRIPFPVEVDSEKVKAKFNNGILEINIAKSEKAQSKSHRIPIQ